MISAPCRAARALSSSASRVRGALGKHRQAEARRCRAGTALAIRGVSRIEKEFELRRGGGPAALARTISMPFSSRARESSGKPRAGSSPRAGSASRGRHPSSAWEVFGNGLDFEREVPVFEPPLDGGANLAPRGFVEDPKPAAVGTGVALVDLAGGQDARYAVEASQGFEAAEETRPQLRARAIEFGLARAAREETKRFLRRWRFPGLCYGHDPGRERRRWTRNQPASSRPRNKRPYPVASSSS